MSDRILADRYQLLEQIGQGGMAIVYRALDLRTGHSVAVKLLRPDLAQNMEYVNRFQREAQAASKMTHHNIVNLLDVGMDGESRYLVMEFVQGKTLKQLIQENGRIPPDTAISITIRILSALQHAHDNGIIHRDIKPQNILVDETGIVKVADFGIARIANTQTLTRSDIVMGSVHYFSPEQASGKATDIRSDIYSVGVVLYEMLTGKLPFDGENQVAIAYQHLHATPTPIVELAPEVSPTVAHVCMVAMSKKPGNRYQSAREMAAELRLAQEGSNEVLQHHPLETRAQRQPAREPQKRDPSAGEAPEQTDKRKKKRVNWVWWAATTAVLAVIGAVTFLWLSGWLGRQNNTVTVPAFVGSTLEEAEAAAGKEQIRLQVEESYNDRAGEGLIYLQTPEAGEQITRDKTVTVTVSKGPRPVVPELVGRQLADAQNACIEAGLTPTIERRMDYGYAEGFVCEQDPASGSPTPEDGRITLYVSTGVTTVPDVRGVPVSAAISALQNAGLKVDSVIDRTEVGDTSLHATVNYTNPTAIQTARGTVIKLNIYVVPSLCKHADVPLVLPDSEGEIKLRVTLELYEGMEINFWERGYTADMPREQTIPLESWIGGTFVMRVYRVGSSEPEFTQEVTLQ